MIKFLYLVIKNDLDYELIIIVVLINTLYD